MTRPLAASKRRLSGRNGSRHRARGRISRRWTTLSRGHLAASGFAMGWCATCSSWRKEPSGQSPVPSVEPLGLPGRFPVARPRFGWRVAVKMLMGPDVVVPAAEFDQLAAQVVAVGDGDA